MNRNFSYFKDEYGVDGARDKFEDAFHTIISSLYKGENVKTVKVKQGDGGIDVFIGDFGQKPLKVYQCKFFLDSIGESQKDQIRSSFKTAIESTEFEIEEWILCVPYQELDTKEHKWWADWKTKQETAYKNVKITLYDGKTILDLAHQTGTYNSVFEIEDSLAIKNIQNTVQDLFSKTEEISSKLDNLTYVTEKLSNHLGKVVNILVKNIQYSGLKSKILPPEPENKMTYNDLKKYKSTIRKYGEFGTKLEKIYSTLNDEKPNTQTRFYNNINDKYLLIKDDIISKSIDKNITEIDIIRKNSDTIFDAVINEMRRDYINSNNFDKDIDNGELHTCLLVIAVDAFISCHILERPPEI